jgi:dTDP-D-glucose 4,6-dehydratase
MQFGDLTANHLGKRMRVYGGTEVVIGRIQHEIYHGKARTVIGDSNGLRRWIYVSDRECTLS